MKLFPGENIINALSIQKNQNKDLILITNKGSFIKHATKEIKTSKKGELGTMGIKLKDNKVINCFINKNIRAIRNCSFADFRKTFRHIRRYSVELCYKWCNRNCSIVVCAKLIQSVQRQRP